MVKELGIFQLVGEVVVQTGCNPPIDTVLIKVLETNLMRPLYIILSCTAEIQSGVGSSCLTFILCTSGLAGKQSGVPV